MLKGSMPALVTPFKDGAVDFDTLKRLVEWHIEQGSHGLVPVGTTGESPTLSHVEHELVIEEVVKAAAGRLPPFVSNQEQAIGKLLGKGSTHYV